jgi:hypothetical protein
VAVTVGVSVAAGVLVEVAVGAGADVAVGGYHAGIPVGVTVGVGVAVGVDVTVGVTVELPGVTVTVAPAARLFRCVIGCRESSRTRTAGKSSRAERRGRERSEGLQNRRLARYVASQCLY